MKVSRNTLKEFGCYEDRVEKLMRELGAEIEATEKNPIRPGESFVSSYNSKTYIAISMAAYHRSHPIPLLDSVPAIRIDSFGLPVVTSVPAEYVPGKFVDD